VFAFDRRLYCGHRLENVSGVTDEANDSSSDPPLLGGIGLTVDELMREVIDVPKVSSNQNSGL
jgi:hypothetical protein